MEVEIAAMFALDLAHAHIDELRRRAHSSRRQAEATSPTRLHRLVGRSRGLVGRSRGR